jgi:hypothetical protein
MFWNRSDAKAFEDHVEKVLKRKYPKAEWNLEPQSPITSKGTKIKVDFRLTNRKKRTVTLVDAKSGRITVGDLRQIEDYKRACKASNCIIYAAAPLSQLSDSIKQRAKKSNIKIVHTRWEPDSF